MSEANTRPAAKQLGPNGPTVPPLGLGSWHTWDRMEFEHAVTIIRRAVDAGMNLFDVAYYNSGPHLDNSPTDLIFAKAVREAGLHRKDYVLCGKLWLWDYPEKDFRSQLDVSLDRLGVDQLDTAVIGDYTSIDIPTVVTDVAEQIRSGRLGSWGTNNWPYSDFVRAYEFAQREGMPLPTFVQLKYGIARRSMAESDQYGKLFADGTIALQASDTFEGGILAGKQQPDRQIGADPGSVRDLIRGIADEVSRIAGEFNATSTQLGIAFCLANPAVANVLFGVSKLSQLEDNLGAVELAARYGQQVRAAVDQLWVDREAVNAEGTVAVG